MNNFLRIIISCLICLGTASCCSSVGNKRIDELEKRLAVLESSIQPVIERERTREIVKNQRIRARTRMRKDSVIYSKIQRREIENLYQIANKNWRTEKGRLSLEKLIEKYDKANRVGCALLYLGQMSKGVERRKYFQKAIDGFSDCYYGNGVQVGPYARYYLACYYKLIGETEKARKLNVEILREYPNAINHKGNLLASVINQ